MFNLKITPRSIVVTKTRSGKFTDLQKVSSNLRQYNGNHKAENICSRTKTKLKNCIKNVTEAKILAEKKNNSTQHAVVASADTVSQSANIRPSTCDHRPPLRAIVEPLAYFTTLTTIHGTTETEAKKYLNIYLTQLRKTIDIYIWTCEISSGSIIHFHLLTFEQPTTNWKHITKNYYKAAVQVESLYTKTEIEKVTNYILKDDTKEQVQGRKYGASRQLYAYQPITIQLTESQASKIESEIIQESEHYIIATTPKKIQKYLREYYLLLFLDKRSVIQTTDLEKKLYELALDQDQANASQGLQSFSSAVPPLVPI